MPPPTIMSCRYWLVTLICLLLISGGDIRAAQWLVLSDLQLIDGTGKAAYPVAALVIQDGIIHAINPPEPLDVAPTDSVTRIDLNGAWVMPGLIDTHVHVARFPETLKQAERILKQAVRGGVTGVRDMGGDARTLAELTRALFNQEWAGPALAYAGIYGGPSLFDDQRIAGLAPGFAPGGAAWTRAITAQTDLKLAVAETKGAGATGIKLYGNLDAELATRVIHQAHQQNLKTWAHATVFPAGPGQLVDAGVNVLSHAAYLVWEAAEVIPADYQTRTDAPWDQIPPDHPRLIALFAKMARQGVYLDATLYVYQTLHQVVPPGQAEWAQAAAAWGARVTAVAHRMGVKITAGTDWFEPDGDELPHTHEELALLVEQAGLSPLQAIVAATRNGAGALGLAEVKGTLMTGHPADLLILTDNPLEDIRNTRKIRTVVRHGRLIEPL